MKNGQKVLFSILTKPELAIRAIYIFEVPSSVEVVSISLQMVVLI